MGKRMREMRKIMPKYPFLHKESSTFDYVQTVTNEMLIGKSRIDGMVRDRTGRDKQVGVDSEE